MRFDHRQLIVQIMEDGDVEGAMAHILSITKGDLPKRRRAVFDNVRTKILKEEKYRNPEGYAQLEQLARRQDLNPTDRVKLQTLLFKPLHFIRWAQVHRCFLSDPYLQEELRNIRIVKDPFYEFDTPQNIKLMVSKSIQDGVMSNHSHKTRPRETYRYTNQEVDEMIQQAIDFIGQDLQWSKKCNSLRLLECLCLLTGRRKWELCSTLKIRTVPTFEYQAEVQGLGKNLITKLDPVWNRIPLLAPISVVIRGITNLRLCFHSMGKYEGGKKLFPRLNHTHYRNLYSEKCFELREINKFCEGDSCSKMEWQRRALHVTMAILADRYLTLLLTDEPEQQPDMAGEVCGSRSDDGQDSLRCGGQHTDQQEQDHPEYLQTGNAGSSGQ